MVQCIEPTRCLFGLVDNQADNLNERHTRSKRLQEEVRRACQKSTEHFRQTYDFDLEKLNPSPLTLPNASQNFEKEGIDMDSRRLSASCATLLTEVDAEKRPWQWEQINIFQRYVPPFYRSARYHSDGCLRMLCEKGIPQTPSKTVSSTWRRILGILGDSTVNDALSDAEKTMTVNEQSYVMCKKPVGHELKKELPDKTVAQPFKTPSLCRIWRARVRRSSHTGPADHKTEKVRVDTTSQSDDEIEKKNRPVVRTSEPKDKDPHGDIRVPHPSPIKQVGRGRTDFSTPVNFNPMKVSIKRNEIASNPESPEVHLSMDAKPLVSNTYPCNTSKKVFRNQDVRILRQMRLTGHFRHPLRSYAFKPPRKCMSRAVQPHKLKVGSYGNNLHSRRSSRTGKRKDLHFPPRNSALPAEMPGRENATVDYLLTCNLLSSLQFERMTIRPSSGLQHRCPLMVTMED
ncbi:unnamed protein product [Calicophoron daubneyi]|uniref:Uncharacterized protein n=1 Tax=Calicophoron daubneyi TaxID=300641 RepID=A0AAV2T5J3_CALDB